jgi:rRNA-processing protein FCF1
MNKEMLVYGNELLILLDEMGGKVTFPEFEEKIKIKGDDLRSLLRYLEKKEFLRYSLGLFVNTSKISESTIELLPAGMEVILGKKDYFTGRERIIEKKVKTKVIFDTNIYDLIADGTLNINLLSVKKEGFEFYITHIQIDEINKCPDEDRRARLSLFVTKLSPIVIPTESFVLDKSRLGEARLGDGKILEEIRKENIEHTEDALIGETAIKNDLLLVTHDSRFKNKVNSLGGRAIDFEEFGESLK